MRVSTLVIVTLVVVLAITTEHDAYSFAYHIPSSSSRRRSLREQSGSSICMYQRSRDNMYVTAIRSSAGGQENGNDNNNNNNENENYHINDNEIFQAYSEWQKEYRKGEVGDDSFDNIRFQNFKTNLLKLILVNTDELNNARQSGNPDPIPMTLNEYGDYSADEFTAGTQQQPQQPQQQQSAEFSLMGVEEQNRIQQTYMEWCSVNGKIYQDSRLDIFAFNLYVVENYCQETGKKVDLNKFADLSPEEYELDSSTAKIGGSSYLENLSINAQTSSSSLSSSYQYQYQYRDEAERETIRQSYIDWCIANEREYVESRLDAFANNFLAIESYRKETGKNVKLSKHADLSPEEYNAMEASTPTSDDTRMVKNNRNSYLESLNTPMTGYPPDETLTIAEETICAVYQDWCQYYGKVPTEEGLHYFTGSYNALEKHYRETGEELTLNENADSPAPGTDSEYQRIKSADNQTVLDNAKVQLLEEEQRKVEAARLIKEEKERSEQTRWEYEQQVIQENERQRLEEDVRLKKEQEERERIRFEEAQLKEERIRVDNVRLVEEERQQYTAAVEIERDRLREEKNRVELGLRIDRARLEEMKRLEEEARIELDKTNYQLDETLRNDELQSPTIDDDDDNDEKAETFFLPRGSYMNAVAKTWVDRSAYLESLQQGKTGVLPENPDINQQSVEKDNETRTKRPESLINSIWNFMKDDRNGLATEQYSNNLIQQADKMIAEASKLSGIEEEELQHLKVAVDALRRRNEDDRAAERARTETKEWGQIQKGLEREAKRARERRESDERIAEEARRKARSLKSERSRYEKSAAEKSRESATLRRPIEPAVIGEDNINQGNPFLFFPSPFQFSEIENASNSPAAKMQENVISFFGKSSNKDRITPLSKTSTQPVEVEKNDSWLGKLFDFFGRENEEEEMPGLGTITLEPAKRTSVFDFFVTPDAIAPREPGRGSITIEDSPKPSIFSSFAKFGLSRNKVKTIDPERQRKVIDYENKLRSRQEKLSWFEAGRSRILEQTDKNMSRKEARRLQRELDSLAAGNSTSSIFTSTIPQLAKWTQTPDGRITGWISETGGRYKMGTKITTSRIKGKVVKPGITVTTISGSQYRLGLSAAAASSSFDSSTDRRSKSQRRASNQRPLQPISPMGDLFGRLFTGEDVPSLVEWTQNEDGTLTGFVNNKDGFDDGTQITTSPVRKGASSGMLVETGGGSKYKLMKEKTRYSIGR